MVASEDGSAKLNVTFNVNGIDGNFYYRLFELGYAAVLNLEKY